GRRTTALGQRPVPVKEGCLEVVRGESVTPKVERGDKDELREFESTGTVHRADTSSGAHRGAIDKVQEQKHDKPLAVSVNTAEHGQEYVVSYESTTTRHGTRSYPGGHDCIPVAADEFSYPRRSVVA
ncbi:unnamed protein product, partial [Sphacelaria rigidula]